MAANPTGLGKGLDALIRETSEARESGGVQQLPIKDILPNPNQPRRKFSEKSLEELAASIRSQGILQPLLVRPCGPAKPGKYEIVAGERRWRASQLAGLTELPVVVRSFSAQETLVAALIENLQREDLNPIEEALGIQTLKEEFDLSQEELSKKLGKSRSAIANSLRLLVLPENIRKELAEGRLSAGHARALLSVTEPQAQEQLKTLIIERRLSVREAEGLAATWKETGIITISGLASFLAGDDGESADEETPEPLKSAEEERTASGTDAEQVIREGKKSKPQSAKLIEIQTRLGSALNMAVRVTGKEDKGKISFSYNSKDELEALLHRLSLPALEAQLYPSLVGAAHPVLAGQEHASLSGSEYSALEATRHAPLTHTDNPVLAGADNSALSGADNAALSSSGHVSLDSAKHQALDGAHNAVLGPGRHMEALVSQHTQDTPE